MPSYAGDSVTGIDFANQKQYISSYLLRSDIRPAFDQCLQGYDMGKGRLRFHRPEPIDYDLVRDLLHATAANTGTVC